MILRGSVINSLKSHRQSGCTVGRLPGATKIKQIFAATSAATRKQLRAKQEKHERSCFNRAAGDTRQVPGETGQLRPLNSSRRSR